MDVSRGVASLGIFLATGILTTGIEHLFPAPKVPNVKPKDNAKDDLVVVHPTVAKLIKNNVLLDSFATISDVVSSIIQLFYADYTPHWAGTEILTLGTNIWPWVWRAMYLKQPGRRWIVAGTAAEIGMECALMWSMVGTARAAQSRWPLLAAVLHVPLILWTLDRGYKFYRLDRYMRTDNPYVKSYHGETFDAKKE